MMNRNGDRPYNAGRFRSLLTELAARSGIRDDDGRIIDLQRTHAFRHTAATSLLNAGVPLHVVQRWLGHLTPAMTMTYAVYPEEAINGHRAFIARRRQLRPSEEYRSPTDVIRGANVTKLDIAQVVSWRTRLRRRRGERGRVVLMSAVR